MIRSETVGNFRVPGVHVGVEVPEEQEIIGAYSMRTRASLVDGAFGSETSTIIKF
jgi:hypothetical protein